MRKLLFLLGGCFALSGCYVVNGVRAESGALAVMAPVHVANIVDTEEEMAQAFQRADKDLVARVDSKFELTMKAPSADHSWRIAAVSTEGIVENISSGRDEKDPDVQWFSFAAKAKGKTRIVFECDDGTKTREEYMTVTVE